MPKIIATTITFFFSKLEKRKMRHCGQNNQEKNDPEFPHGVYDGRACWLSSSGPDLDHNGIFCFHSFCLDSGGDMVENTLSFPTIQHGRNVQWQSCFSWTQTRLYLKAASFRPNLLSSPLQPPTGRKQTDTVLWFYVLQYIDLYKVVKIQDRNSRYWLLLDGDESHWLLVKS